MHIIPLKTEMSLYIYYIMHNNVNRVHTQYLYIILSQNKDKFIVFKRLKYTIQGKLGNMLAVEFQKVVEIIRLRTT